MEELNIAVASDIHLGHKRNPAYRIVQNLRDAFPDNAETAALDIIFLAGDVFDSLLTCPSDEATDADIWIAHLLRLCKKHDIALRVLNGTNSHDFNQSERFVTINEIAGIGADLHYAKDLSIEYIEKYDIHVLYVPDEWESSTEKTLAQVKDLIRAKGLTQVDLAIMHGQFEFQLPPHIKAQKHSSEEYLGLVKHLIFIGHVHTHRTYERIIAQGSFDRLSHGEEEPKGHVRATIRPNGEYEVRFIENKNAMTFQSVDCTDLDLDDTLKKIANTVGHRNDNIFVRIIGDPDNPIFTNMNMLVSMYPFVTWSKLIKEADEEITTEYDDAEVNFQPIILNKENLPGLLLERLAYRGVKNGLLSSAKAMLKEVI